MVREYNPDLLVSSDSKGVPIHLSQNNHSDFPYSQHMPTISHVGVEMPVRPTKQVSRWNIHKADWSGFTANVEKTIHCIPLVPKQYSRFMALLLAAAKKYIP